MSLPEIDTLAFFLINKNLQNSLFDILMPFITDKSYLIFMPLFLLLFFKDREKALIALILGIVSLLIADWSGNILKHSFERIRPCDALDGVRLLAGCGKSFSMPSNHSVNAFAFISPLCMLLKNRMRYAFVAVAILVGFSRVYIGVHYPSDTIAGALLGVMLGISVVQFYHWSSERFKEKPETTILFVFLLSLSLFRIYYIQNGPMDLSPDEAHYWEWSRRLDLSYYSKGPMIAYLIYLGTSLFGDTVFGIRFMAVLFSALSSILMYSLGKKMYDEKVGLFSAIMIQIIPLFSTYGIFFTIDSPFIFFWISSLFLFREAVNQSQISRHSESPEATNLKSQKYWLLLGLSIGLGLLTKYTMAFFYLCACLFLALSAEKRRLLLTIGPYIALIISLIVFSPVMLWNAQHDWVTLKHTAGQAHIAQGIQLSLKSFAEFMGSQLGVITPLLLMLMIISVLKLRKEQEGSYLFWFSIPVLAFFLFKSIQAKVQANWALPGYIAGIISFSAVYLRRFDTDGKGKKILVTASLILSLIITSMAHYPSMLDLPAKLDPASRVQGWEVLGEEVARIYEQMSSANPVFIFSDRYQVSSELAFYVKGHPVTYCINLGRRMNQYDIWPGLHNLRHYDAIFVSIGDNRLPEEVAASFDKVEKKVYTAYTKKHAVIRDYSIFMCYGFKGLKEARPEAY